MRHLKALIEKERAAESIPKLNTFQTSSESITTKKTLNSESSQKQSPTENGLPITINEMLLTL